MELLAFWVDILLPILTIAIPVFATLYTVNNRIKNENREEHKPYLMLEGLEELKSLNVYEYYLTFIGRNYREKNGALSEEDLKKIGTDHEIYISLCLKNIGYGVASNIKFYNLLTGEEIIGTQESIKNANQKLFTTFDIAKEESKKVQCRVLGLVEEIDDIIAEDHNRILCIYKDLNNNTYSIIITINMKDENHFDFFAYQPTSRSYKKWIKENRHEHRKIYKEYTRL